MNNAHEIYNILTLFEKSTSNKLNGYDLTDLGLIFNDRIELSKLIINIIEELDYYIKNYLPQELREGWKKFIENVIYNVYHYQTKFNSLAGKIEALDLERLRTTETDKSKLSEWFQEVKTLCTENIDKITDPIISGYLTNCLSDFNLLIKNAKYFSFDRFQKHLINIDLISQKNDLSDDKDFISKLKDLTAKSWGFMKEAPAFLIKGGITQIGAEIIKTIV